jgi:hypothetical protein
MTRRQTNDEDGADDASLARRLAAFVRDEAPVAYCDQCLALRFAVAFAAVRSALLLLANDTAFVRQMRQCSRCGSTVNLTAPR